MSHATFQLSTPAETAALGAALGDVLQPGDVIALSGPLGAGKTTLARAVIQRRCGVRDAPSPTFTLVETYAGDDLTIWHFDFYRLAAPDDAWELGVEDAFSEGASLIEWPECAPSVLPDEALSITFSVTDGNRRAIITAAPVWRERLQKIADQLENQTTRTLTSTDPNS